MDLREAFKTDPNRVAKHSLHAPHVFADLSKNHLDDPALAKLFELARVRGVEPKRDAMFAGGAINTTEQRSVGHVRLRDPADAVVIPVLNAFLAYAEKIRADHTITDIVNIGIGGSDLGPAFVVQALTQFRMPVVQGGKRFHFVSNIDGHELHHVLQNCVAKKTLFIVASKTLMLFMRVLVSFG